MISALLVLIAASLVAGAPFAAYTKYTRDIGFAAVGTEDSPGWVSTWGYVNSTFVTTDLKSGINYCLCAHGLNHKKAHKAPLHVWQCEEAPEDSKVFKINDGMIEHKATGYVFTVNIFDSDKYAVGIEPKKSAMGDLQKFSYSDRTITCADGSVRMQNFYHGDRKEPGSPLIIGHRGTTFEAPENTMPAFEHAIMIGADGFETDLQLTKDNILLLSHDSSLNRTTVNCFGEINDYTYEELKGCDAGSKFAPEFAGTPLPLFEDALALAAEHSAYLVMDLKVLRNEDQEKMRLQLVTELLEKYPAMQKRIFSSCRTEWQVHHYKHIPSMLQRLGSEPAIFDKTWLLAEVSEGIRSFSLSHHTVTDSFVSLAHSLDIPIITWSPDTAILQSEVMWRGFDGAISGDPRMLLALKADLNLRLW